MDDLFEIMQTTRSMRRLKPDPVPDELIRKILEAGVCAANGGNTQRWRFLVIKDPKIKQAVQTLVQAAFDEVVGPRYATSAPPPGVTPERYKRQHAAVEYLTDHFPRSAGVDRRLHRRGQGAPDALVRRVDLSGGAEHAAGDARAGPGLDADHAASAVREGGRGGDGPAGGRALLRHPADRLSDGSLRSGRAAASWRRSCTRINGASPTPG